MKTDRSLLAVIKLGASFVVAGVLLAAAFHAKAELFNVHANGEIHALAIQPDGKILVGGQIYEVDGQRSTAIVRLLPNGTLDYDFNVPSIKADYGSSFIDSILLQSDGKIVIYGDIVKINEQDLLRWARLNPNGTLDASFNPTAANPTLALGLPLGIQSDGKILVYASATNATRDYFTNLVIRLNSDGSIDPTFANPVTGNLRFSPAMCAAFDSDGRILIGGKFTSFAGQPRNNVARLNPDGSLDSSFTPPTIDPQTTVTTVLAQPDGKVLIGGSFLTVGGQPRKDIARLQSDGQLDPSFNRGGGNMIGLGVPNSMVLQTDGKLIVAGYFSDEYVPGKPYGIRRLNPDGSVDDTFDSSIVGEWIYALALQADGRALVGGYFTMSTQSYKQDVGRLGDPNGATQELSLTESAITWLRGGSGPEVWATSFEYSADGVDWQPLGKGTRIPGGWQRAIPALPAGSAIRARGFTAGGKYNRSSWFTETVIGRPAITAHPLSRTNNAGTTARFDVAAGGDEPLGYKWKKDGAPLDNRALISGADSPTLTLSNVVSASAGHYSVTVSNSLGRVTSFEAELSVIDPAINAQPVSQLVNGGMPATLSATVGGTEPLTYQWFKDGDPVERGTNATLQVDTVRWSDRGDYYVIIQNSFGTVTSAVATLTVNMAALTPFQTTNIVGEATAILVQPDGKIVVASEWSEVSEMPIDYLVRLNSDGTLDNSFNPRLQDFTFIYGLALEPDGKIIVGGSFTGIGGGACSNLARLNPDGSLDRTFAPNPGGPVNRVILQPDGKLVVGGNPLPSLAGNPCPNIGRLNPDGTSDQTFHPQFDVLYDYLPAAQPDGKILAQVIHTIGVRYPYATLHRLRPDGTLDSAFMQPEFRSTTSYVGWLQTAVLADGKLLVRGTFESVSGLACTNLARLNPDGSLDTSFVDPRPSWYSGPPSVITGFAQQTDGRMLVGGYFQRLAGVERNCIGRLEPDGTLDETFNPSASSTVNEFAFLPDGKVLAGGAFWGMTGQPRRALAFLSPTSPAVDYLSCDGTTIAWLRTGSAPEIGNALFEYSTDGTNWTRLGMGNRIPGGWQLKGLSVPSGATVRAHGFISTSRSSWSIQKMTIANPQTRPAIPIDSKLGFKSEQFGFGFGNDAGALVVERSSDLIKWFPCSTNVPSIAELQFADPESTNAPAKFYRLRRWP